LVLFCYGWAFFVTAMLCGVRILLYDVDGLLLGKDYSPLFIVQIYKSQKPISSADDENCTIGRDFS
jgi:hypothetical protein